MDLHFVSDFEKIYVFEFNFESVLVINAIFFWKSLKHNTIMLHVIGIKKKKVLNMIRLKKYFVFKCSQIAKNSGNILRFSNTHKDSIFL